MVCVDVDHMFRVHHALDSLSFLDPNVFPFPGLGNFSPKKFSVIFFLASPSQTPKMWMLVYSSLSQRPLNVSSILKILFVVVAVIQWLLVFQSLIHSSASSGLLLIPSSVFFVSVIMLLMVDSLFFISSMLLLNVSCIFSIHASILFICASILFLKFWVICTVITMNSFSGRLPIFSLFVWFGIPWSAACFSVFSLCLIFCVWGLLYVGCKIIVPLTCGACSHCVGLDQCFVKVSWGGGWCWFLCSGG